MIDYSFNGYEPLFVHYCQQLKHVLAARPQTVLEIGPGDNTVRDFLLRRGISVKTIDIDPQKKPDFLGDFRTMELGKVPKADLVLCSEVLEHMDFEKWFEKSLERLQKLSKRSVVLSLPLATIRIGGSKGKLFGADGVIKTRIPWFFLKYPSKSDEDFSHHWEIGKVGTGFGVVMKKIERYFKVDGYTKYYSTNCVIFDLSKRE